MPNLLPFGLCQWYVQWLYHKRHPTIEGRCTIFFKMMNAIVDCHNIKVGYKIKRLWYTLLSYPYQE